MAKLTSKGRKRMRKSQFAIPSQRAYPIHDISHARNALSRAKQKRTKGSYSTVRKAVLKKYPSLRKRKPTRRRTRRR